jgi:DNA polymerase I-like protein with 3'-5' exonuclease and polymerase domains
VKYTVWCSSTSVGVLEEILPGVCLRPEPDIVPVAVRRAFPPIPDGALLLMGTPFLKAMQDMKLVKRNASLTSCRETVFDLDGTKALLTFDPTLVLRERERLTDVLWDMNLCARLARTGSTRPEIGTYRWVEDFSDLVKRFRGLEGKLPRIALDLETTGLDAFARDARILTVALSAAAGEAYVYRVPPNGQPSTTVLKQLRALLCGPRARVVGANLKFDLVWLAAHWEIRGIRQIFDTHLVGSLLDENRSNSLETHAKLYTAMGGYDMEFNRAHDKGSMAEALDADPDGFLTYAGGDVDACLRVATEQRRFVRRDTRLTRFFTRLLLPAAKVFAKVEERGIVVDAARYAELEAQCRADVAALTAEALSHVPRRLLLKYADNLSPTRPALLRDYLFTRRGLNLTPELVTPKAQAALDRGEPVDLVANASTAAEHLQRFSDVPEAKPFVEAMAKLGVTNKILSTYIVGFRRHLRDDGKFHPSYRMGRGSSADDAEGGTVTGRLSATDPAYQTLVKRGVWAKPLRSVFPCPSGYAIVKFDFSQGELRITAVVADDPVMLDAYRHGKDIHALTAASMTGVTLEQFMAMPEEVVEERRRAAKAVNFGFLYGMQAPGLVDYARKSYGVLMTLPQAQSYRGAFFDTYAALEPYHARIKEYAHRHQMVRNPLGRIRHLPLIRSPFRDVVSMAERQAINSPIQSCLSDMMLLAMVELDRRWPDLWIFGMTHDSLELYVPLDDVDVMVPAIKDVMENLPVADFGWTPGIPFVVDAEVATAGTLADVKKVKA